MIVTIFFTWHTSRAVVKCAKHRSDMIARKSIVTILITMEKSLVKWAPGLGATLDLIVLGQWAVM